MSVVARLVPHLQTQAHNGGTIYDDYSGAAPFDPYAPNVKLAAADAQWRLSVQPGSSRYRKTTGYVTLLNWVR
jgi:hypothetical protein